ncbi:MAG TPA: XkdF-like putative serine protease domain-containing protein, partial [Acidobacteriota bacterium]|nr:XkdF-like putative serine protease domain-containing protein [Acidobacteriota bacterium]
DKDDHKKEVSKQSHINSPTLAYKAVYGVIPSEPLGGQTDSPKKNWHGLQVDKHIKDSWLEELNAIPGVEIRASDEGKDKDRVAFIVFRLKDKERDSVAQSVSKKLSSMDRIYSLSDTGREGRPRVVVAGKVAYGKKGWESWWSTLAGKIKEAVKSIRKDDSPYFKFLKVNEKEYIVGGVVYSANDVDTQGDAASTSEIWKAIKKFMIKGGKIKVMHKGQSIKAPVVECYQAEEDHHKGGTGDKHLIKSGDWYISVYLGDEKETWKDVVEGKLNGFSMGGTAKSANQ